MIFLVQGSWFKVQGFARFKALASRLLCAIVIFRIAPSPAKRERIGARANRSSFWWTSLTLHQYRMTVNLNHDPTSTLNQEPGTLNRYVTETIPGSRLTSGSPPFSVTSTQPPQVVSKFPSGLYA